MKRVLSIICLAGVLLYGCALESQQERLVRALRANASLSLTGENPEAALAVDYLLRIDQELGEPLTATDKSLLAYAYTLLGEEELAKTWQKEAVRSAVEEAQERRAEQEKLRITRTWALVLIFALFAVALYWIRRNYRSRMEAALVQEKAETERLMHIAEDLQDRLRRSSSRILEQSGLGVLEKLCEQFYIYEGTGNLQDKILNEVHSIVEGLRADTSALEALLDAEHDNLMRRFKEAFPRLPDFDLRLFTYSAAGFSPTTISALMGKDKQYIYNRTYRLKGRIASSDSPDRNFFLGFIGK